MRKTTKILSILLCFLLIFEQSGFAQVAGQLDISGYLVDLHNALAQDKFRPLHLRYLAYDTLNNNFKLLLDKGDLKDIKTSQVQETTQKLLEYFFVGVSLPNSSFWVNLRPDSPDNIIDPYLAQTDVGKILLEADLQLKKDTAKYTSPENPKGKEYWEKLYKKAGEFFGYDNIVIPTITRPWIVPDEIIVREANDNAYIYKATLKVQLEQDYLQGSVVYNFNDPRLKDLNEYSSQLIRELIIPELTKEINISKRYAPLRQVYYSLILSQWFKQKFSGRGGFYSTLIDRRNLNGITSKENWSETVYFKEYQKSFQKGEYNIQQPISTPFGQTIRSYFSGGIDFGVTQGQGGVLTTAIQRDLVRASSPGDILAGNSHTLPVDVNKGGTPDNVGVDRKGIQVGKIQKSSSPFIGHGKNTDALDRASVEKIVVIDAKEATKLTDNNTLQLIRRSRTPYLMFEFYRNRNTNKIQITIQPTYREEEIWRDPIWKMRQELKRHIPYLSSQEIWTIVDESNSLILGGSAALTDIFSISFINNRREYDKKTKQYFTGERIYDPVKNMLSSPDYSHTDLFSWIHTYETKELEHILQENSGKVSVLDIGAGSADFILTSHLLLRGYEDRISYVGVDISEANLKPAINYSKGLTDLSAQFLTCDIQNPEFRNRVLAANRGELYDVVIANHIAEHLEGKAIVDSLGEWLSITRRLLIVSLPIEENLGTGVSLHYEQITADSLIEIGRRIEQATGNRVIADVTHVHSGILTLRRVEVKSHPDNDSPDVKSSGVDTVTSLPTTEGKHRLGGIDFHTLPIVTQPINTPSVNLTAIPVNRLNYNGFDSEWTQIQNMLNGGIIPSSQRVKEYFEACYQKNRLNNEIDNILNCIADIMRIEEERVLTTDQGIKNLLVLLESSKTVDELRSILNKINFQSKKSDLIPQ